MTTPRANDPASIAGADDGTDRLDIIDIEHFSTFTDGDRDLEAELFDLYRTTAARYLSAMEDALSEERTWSAEAHALKGASGNLGARRVAALAKNAEFDAPSSTQLQALRDALDEVVAFFEKRHG